ncbi:ribosome biogenesis protein Nop53/GLTSCR2 [Tricharina praecox]|uniref:ribosome biogenesis protein Nop53/GLTSCR2 n=1 Tax=Tricharina praecox TaxID=43433 RepID=UPI00222077AD|nr:ribosome biogenesis protein Nop53/GLTSCR2 [Tricharina praecox]KAI5844734.1 ribosome biogenesis protein Nop53/GLTSCR2 [Tricharina praecox]
MSTAPPGKSKQPSRKGKKAWRKNVDISAVETGLEQVREEITQGGVIKEKSDDLLFAMDFGGDDAIVRREARTLKPLKSDQILAARSAIPAVDTRKRIGAVTDGVLVKKAKRKDGVSFAQLQRLRQIAYGGASRAAGPELVAERKVVPDYDAWGTEAEEKFKKKTEIELEGLDFVEKVHKPKAPATLKRKPIALAAIGSVPAVRLPEGGVSYNPDFEMWDKLLREEGEKEVELEKKRIAEEAEEARMQAIIDAPDVEMLSDPEGWQDSDESEDEEEGGSKDSAERREAKRKTQSQKNKAIKQKEQEKQRAEAKKVKQQERELLLVKKYAREIRYQEKLRMAKAIAKMSVDDDEKNPKIMRKKRLGKAHLPRAPLEVQLPDELADSLRTLKPEGNLLGDRFRSLRERGIVEGRTPIIYAKKAKRSSTEKWSYKDFK